MHEMIRPILGVVAAAFAIWLTVQIVNRRKPWMCGIWGALALICGHAAIAPTFNAASNANRILEMLCLICVVGFIKSSWSAKRSDR